MASSTKAQELADETLSRFRNQGEFYRTSSGGLFYHVKASRQNEIIELDPKSLALHSYLTKARVNAASPLFKYVVEEMRAEADRAGKQVEIHRTSHFKNNVIYVDAGSVGGRPLGKMWRISKEGFELVPMGTEGVLFLTDPRDDRKDELSPLLFRNGDRPTLQLPNDLDEFLPTFGGGQLSDRQAKQALMVWVYALFFDLPTNPLLVLWGERESGKTSHARMLLKLYMGMSHDVADVTTYDTRDLAAVLTNLRLAAFDNWDRTEARRFDMIALAATSGEVFRRQYYTTNTLTSFPLIARMIVTQRNPTLARDDLASRLVVLHCLPLERKEPESLMQKLLEAMLPILRRNLFDDLQLILAEWEKGCQGWTTDFRMADYAHLGHIIARVEGREQEWDATLQALQREQHEYLARGEPLVDTVVEFLTEDGGLLEGTAGRLYDLLIAGSPLEAQIPTPGKLPYELKRVKSALACRGVDLQVYEDKHEKQKIYRLEMESDGAKLLQEPPSSNGDDGLGQQEPQSVAAFEEL